MRIVREKLSGRPWPPMAPADLDATSIAVLSARLLLELSPATANAKKYEEELVRNHLRLLYSVNDQRRTIVTGSSPEPLIAEASAQIMHYFIQENQPYFNYWFLLEKYVDHGLANQGAIGELIGRALSISAMDCAIENLHGHSELKYQTPITVADYYQAFLTNDAWEVLRKSTPANRSRLSSDSANTKFEDAFKNAYFHYSHYGRQMIPLRCPTNMRGRYGYVEQQLSVRIARSSLTAWPRSTFLMEVVSLQKQFQLVWIRTKRAKMRTLLISESNLPNTSPFFRMARNCLTSLLSIVMP